MSPRGGYRPGSGRPKPATPKRRTTVYITEHEREQLRQLGDGNVSEGVRRLLRDWQQPSREERDNVDS